MTFKAISIVLTLVAILAIICACAMTRQWLLDLSSIVRTVCIVVATVCGVLVAVVWVLF